MGCTGLNACALLREHGAAQFSGFKKLGYSAQIFESSGQTVTNESRPAKSGSVLRFDIGTVLLRCTRFHAANVPWQCIPEQS